MEEILPWVALKSVSGVGNHLFKRLITRFHTPENVFCAGKSELVAVEGVSHQLAGAIRANHPSDSVKKEIELAKKNKCRILTLNDPEYPPLLLHIPDPPPYLYVRGRLENTETSIAVVGSRNASSYGLAMAKRLSGELSSLKLPIVSGMARGIDTAAHQGALAENGNTIAVLGSGLGVIYPPENRNLFNKIIENGAVISEFPMMEGPNAYNFPARNRIISGITLGTLVVEATYKSGSLITARLAGEQGREVFAVPGNINSLKSTGTHNLIKQGAKLVAGVQDILEEFYQFENQIKQDYRSEKDVSKPGPAGIIDLPMEETRIYGLLEPYPIHIDELGKKAGLSVGKLAGILLNLELKGIVSQSPGKYFTISEGKN